jgi:hypothetical protein
LDISQRQPVPSAVKEASYAPTHVKPVPDTADPSIVAATLAPDEELTMLLLVPEMLEFLMVGEEVEALYTP